MLLSRLLIAPAERIFMATRMSSQSLQQALISERKSKDFPKGGFNTYASTLLQQIGNKAPKAKPAQGS